MWKVCLGNGGGVLTPLPTMHPFLVFLYRRVENFKKS